MLSWLFSAPLPAGSTAPDFTLYDEAGTQVSLRALRGRSVLLVFYPRDHTTVCTRQLCELRDNWDLLRSKGVAVFGVNPQDAASHAGFREKQRYPFPLLVDHGQRVGRLYHADGLVPRRTVYLIGASGEILFSQRGAPSSTEILTALK